jgi:leucine-rich repeat protein SHOC2
MFKKVFFYILIGLFACQVQAQKRDKAYTNVEEAMREPAKVTVLNLKGQDLKTLPEGISKLVNLVQLDLSYNAFTTVPTQVFKVPKLKVLYLNNNAITSLPDVSGLTGLTTLRLDANPLVNPVADLRKLSTLSNLTSLNFSANKVSAFPEELLKMVSLTELDLGYGSIKTLPAAIDRLKNLKRLVLTKNLITNFPPAFFKLPELENLDLSYCDFKTLQADFSNLQLKGLDVSYNKALSAIPPIKDMKYINIKSTKVDIEKLKWALGEGCMIMN